MRAVSFSRMKSLNRHLVLGLLRQEGPLPRREIALRTGLAPSAVANVVADLIALNLVQELGTAPSGGGRPPALVGFHSDASHIIGVNVGYSETWAVLSDLGGNVLVREAVETGPQRDWQAVRRKVIDLIGRLIKVSRGKDKVVRAVGVGIAGWVDSHEGVSVFSPNFGWKSVSVSADLHADLGLPVWIDNDARMATLGEWRYGAGKGTKDFAYVRIGSAVGAAFVVNGTLISGANGTAGEIGHTVIDPDGPRCSCGKFGCLEAMVSGRAIAAKAVAALRRGRESSLWNAVEGDLSRLSSQLVAHHAATGDSLSREVIESAGRSLGTALAMMVNLINPEIIAVGGGVSEAGALIMEPLGETFRRHAVGYAGESTRIVPGSLGRKAGPLGAAEHVIEKLFHPDQLALLLGQ